MAWIFTRGGLTALLVGSALAWPSVGLADAPVVTRAPDIDGSLVVGKTLRAVNGAWTGSEETATGFIWLRCPDEATRTASRSRARPARAIELTDADAGNKMRVTLWATEADETSYKTSDPTAAVKTVSGDDARPGWVSPVFDIPAVPPTTKNPVVLPAGVKLIKPKPVVADLRPVHVDGREDHPLHRQGAEGRDGQDRLQQGHLPGSQADHQGRPHLAPEEVRAHAEVRHADRGTVSRKGYVSQITTVTIREEEGAHAQRQLSPSRDARRRRSARPDGR